MLWGSQSELLYPGLDITVPCMPSRGRAAKLHVRKTRVLLAFVQILLIVVLYFKSLLVIAMPRYLTFSTLLSTIPSKV